MIKRGILLFVGLSILISFIISLINASISFPANDIKINVAGSPMTLQQAADLGYLKGTASSYASSSPISMGQHDASQIWVSVKDGEKNLIDALSSTNKLCPKSSSAVPTGPTDKSQAYHLATEVIFSSGTFNAKSLQQLINDGTLCTTYSWITSGWSSNGACPTTTFTRTVYCKRDDGTNMGTTCGTYSGCSCPTPATSTTTTCTWSQSSSSRCGCLSIQDTPLCYGISGCSSVVGTSCSSSGGTGYCLGGTCSCGSACKSDTLYTTTCNVNSP